MTPEEWAAYVDQRHEGRIAIIHSDWSDESRERADREFPRTPTHRIRYQPIFEIEVEIAPYEDADDVISSMIDAWNDNLVEAGEAWTEAGLRSDGSFPDKDDTEVRNLGSDAVWEPVS